MMNRQLIIGAALLSAVLVLSPTLVFAAVNFDIELENQRDDQYNIESLKVTETENNAGMVPFCYYVTPCTFEFDEDAEFRPNRTNYGYVLEGTLSITHEKKDGSDTETDQFPLRADLKPMSSQTTNTDHGTVEEDIWGDMTVSGGSFFSGIISGGKYVIFGNVTFTDDGDEGRLMLTAGKTAKQQQ
ncbi:MAG: hypothetical protein GEU26_10180 [Nitrososphaeraceae archaeon]|nr:hypothetical protein [Nitrososphaeraceae archaeon]